MKAKLFCRTGELAGSDYDVSEGASLGSAEDNTIVLKASAISKRDARIDFDASTSSYHLVDLTGRGRTQLDGAPVRRKERLGPLHVITIGGKHDFVFHRLEQKPAPRRRHPLEAFREMPAPRRFSDPGTDEGGGGAKLPDFESSDAGAVETVDTELGGTALPAFETSDSDVHGSIRAVSGLVLELGIAGATQTFPLKMGTNVVGRSLRCDVYVPDKLLSREHAILDVKQESVTVRDAGSKNRTYVDGEEVSGPVEAGSGSVIRFGHLEGKIARR